METLSSTHIGHFLTSPLTLSTLSRAITFVTSSAIIYLLTLCVYRILFHPLSAYPGPLLCKITPLVSAWHAYKGDRHLFLHRLHRKYGPIVRWAPTAVSIDSVTALKEIYGHGPNAHNVKKGNFYEAFPAVKGVHNTHNAIDKAEHARKRRVMSQAFSENALKGLESLVLKNVEIFFRVIEERMVKGKEGIEKFIGKDGKSGLDMGAMFTWLTDDILGELCFGRAFGMLVDEGQRFIVGLIDNATHNHHICGHYLPLTTLNLSRLLFPTIAAERWRFILYSRACANERMALHEAGKDQDKRDFFHYLLNAVDPETGKGFETKELWGEANVLMIAGADTTSSALSATLYYLTCNPEKLQAVQTEVREKFSSVTEIVSGKAMNECVYLKACIEEAMRLCPPVPGLLPREISSSNGMFIPASTLPSHSHGAIYLPQGTTLGVNIYTMHHSPTHYPEPFQFLPERWLLPTEHQLGIATPESLETARVANSSFSIGPRGCIGKALALMELRLVLARMMWEWEVERIAGVMGKAECWEGGFRWEGRDKQGKEEGWKGEFRIFDHFTTRKEGPVVAFRKRIVEG